MECTSGSPLPVRVLLLAGWLACRLGWTPEGGIEQKENRYHARFTATTGNISLSLGVLSGKGEDCAISCIRLHTASGALFESRKPSGSGFAESTVQLPGAGSEVSVGKMPNIALEEILSRELEVLARDRVYEEALQVTSRLLLEG
jgi:glucose-6-phosphate dehydrogenase assembly protein OpcA